MKIKYLEEQFKLQMECAKRAEVYQHTILAFGSLLGYVREGGIIGHDNDMDIAILADKVELRHIDKFINEMDKAGLYAYRARHQINPHNKKHWWTSIRMFPRGRGGSAAPGLCLDTWATIGIIKGRER